MGGFSQYTQPKEESSGWRPVLIAVAAVAAVLVVVYALSRSGDKPAPAAPPAYASNLQIRDLHMSTAENFVGGRVTYIEGKLANSGDKSVTGAQVQTIFRNNLGEVVDKQEQPLRVEARPLGHLDWVPLGSTPLASNGLVNFRLTFEHISADWNQGIPEVNFVSVQTK